MSFCSVYVRTLSGRVQITLHSNTLYILPTYLKYFTYLTQKYYHTYLTLPKKYYPTLQPKNIACSWGDCSWSDSVSCLFME